VRAELGLRRNVAGSAAACHAANNQLLEIKVSNNNNNKIIKTLFNEGSTN